MLENIYLANPSGFCAGVKYAISYVEKIRELININPEFSLTPVYVRKEIVHNERVVNDLKGKNIIFVDELDSVPDGATVVFSAHGVSPEVVNYAKKHNMKIGNATCPLVTKVHNKARRLRETHQIIYIGHKGHDEAVGTMGEAEMFLIETITDIEKIRHKIDPNKPLTYLMQTTLSIYDTRLLVDKLTEIFPNIEHPPKNDICYATTQRQQAVSDMIDSIDAMLVIGSINSSNTLRLLELAKIKKPASFRISKAEELDSINDNSNKSFKDYLITNQIKTLGITAGASSPRIIIQETLEKIKNSFPQVKIEPFPGSEEDGMNFKLPRNLLMD